MQVASDLSAGPFTKAGCPKAAYAMNWEAWRPNGLDSHLQYIAMARTKADVSKLYWYMPTNKATKLAFLNEPDLPGSTALDPSTAAQVWLSSAVPYRKNSSTYLISPAVTSDVSLAVPWMDAFMSKASHLLTSCDQAADACVNAGPRSRSCFSKQAVVRRLLLVTQAPPTTTKHVLLGRQLPTCRRGTVLTC